MIIEILKLLFFFGLGIGIFYLQDFISRKQIKRGKWIWTETGNADYEQYYVCSVCGEHDFVKSAYCPNCGARMDGE